MGRLPYRPDGLRRRLLGPAGRFPYRPDGLNGRIRLHGLGWPSRFERRQVTAARRAGGSARAARHRAVRAGVRAAPPAIPADPATIGRSSAADYLAADLVRAAWHL